jgi:1-acyl-sn-glycerol-3-phosphate acyltransferase
MRSTVAAANYISYSEPQELLDSCIRSLESGGSLILFPEGTRSIRRQPLKFKQDAATVAIGSGAEILPIVIQCTPPTLAKHEPWYKIPPSRPFFSIQILTPISLEELVPSDHNPRQARRALNKTFLALFARKLS